MTNSKHAPTMADVAKEAGVAIGTVSRVINGQQVGAEFRDKVEAAIQQLGYQYNSSGRALRTDRQLAQLEREIGRLEEQLAALNREAEENASDYQKLMEIEEKRASLNDALDALYLRWEEMEE